MQEHRLAGEILAAEPERPRIVSQRLREASRAPPPLVFFPTWAKIAASQPAQALVPVRIGEVGPACKRHFESAQRLLKSAKKAQRIAAIIERSRMSRLDR